MLEGLIGLLQMPLFLFILLFLSYLTWSKFLNKGKLGIKNVNNLLDLLIIFIFWTISIGGFVILLFTLGNISNLTLDIPSIIENSPYFIALIGIAILTWIIIYYRNQQVTRENLKKILEKITEYYLISTSLLGGYLLLILLTPLRHFLITGLILFILFSAIVFIVCWGITAKVLFRRISDNFFAKNILIIIIGLVILGGIISLFMVPILSQGEIDYQRYKIYNVGERNQGIYLYSQVNISIFSKGWVTSIPPILALDYKRYNFILNDSFQKDYFSISHIKNNTLIERYALSEIENFNINSHRENGIIGFKILENAIAIKFNREKLDKKDQFIVGGLVNTSILSGSFNYTDNTAYNEVCSINKCKIKMRINSSLDLPVDLEWDSLFNVRYRNIQNISQCGFDRINIFYKIGNNTEQFKGFSCNGANTCDIIITEKKEDRWEKLFEMDIIYNQEEGSVIRHYMNIEKPIETKIDISMIC